jgi:putative protease
MEILAPAGSVDHFTAAVNAGADAVYAGAPGFNARNPSRELHFDEIRAMVEYGRDHGKSVYVALNSLVRESDLPRLIETLAQLESIAPDALIVQDLGVIELVNRYFSSLNLHASTLMFAHSLAGVEILAELGCSRVVLARELSVQEIQRIVRSSPVEIEIFIHGAMCFSYSGGCLFSSYHGGKSGLRGNCVQPCRRKFSMVSSGQGTGGKGARAGYYFSMNDLEGLAYVKQFESSGIRSIKIEGRLRSVNYVDHVVRAYRTVLDADPSHEEEALREARMLVEKALGRKSSSGYFDGARPKNIIASHHSGNIGTYLGRFRKIIRKGPAFYGTIVARQRCSVGERFRLHFDRSGERISFTAKEIQQEGGDLSTNEYTFLLPRELKPKDCGGRVELYRVDLKTGPTGEAAANNPVLTASPPGADETKKISARARNISRLLSLAPQRPVAAPSGRKGRGPKKTAELWLRLDSVKTAFEKLPFAVDRFVLDIDRQAMAQVGQLKRYFGREKNRVIWALPPVMHGRLMTSLKKDLSILIKSGFRSFQVGSLSQLALFSDERVSLYGDYTLNVLNSRAMAQLQNFGLSGLQFSIEADKASLKQAIDAARNRSEPGDGKGRQSRRRTDNREVIWLGLTVYGAPPLFISRAPIEHIPHNQVITSPRGEQFMTQKKGSESYTRPVKPFSLLPYKNELTQMGLNYVVIDLTGMKSSRREMQDLASRIEGKGRLPKLPTFNYLGTLE